MKRMEKKERRRQNNQMKRMGEKEKKWQILENLRGINY